MSIYDLASQVQATSRMAGLYFPSLMSNLDRAITEYQQSVNSVSATAEVLGEEETAKVTFVPLSTQSDENGTPFSL
jgi:hypothetical protein